MTTTHAKSDPTSSAPGPTPTPDPAPTSGGQPLRNRPRTLTPPAHRAALLAEFAASGLSGAKFAALHGIRYQTFAAWRRSARLAAAGPPFSASAAAAGGPLAWLEVVPAPAAAPAGLDIHLPGGARLVLADASQAGLAAHLLRALAAGVLPSRAARVGGGLRPC